jgi:hypothetical protein
MRGPRYNLGSEQMLNSGRRPWWLDSLFANWLRPARRRWSSAVTLNWLNESSFEIGGYTTANLTEPRDPP